MTAFNTEHVGPSNGTLAFVLVVTRSLKSMTFPVNASSLKTAQGGQVKGLGGAATDSILKDHGITRRLASEGGRTSRGNLGRLEAYVDAMNSLWSAGKLDLDDAEAYWVQQVLTYWAQQPFTFKLDPSKSLRSSIRHLISQAVSRQQAAGGKMYAGTVMQHLVGAKLDLVKEGEITHHGASVADAPTNRAGDFLLGDVAIHVSAAPSEGLMRKVVQNLEAGLRPVIITTENGLGGAKASATLAGIEDRVDVIEIEQFISMNVYEWSKFDRDSRPTTVGELIRRYNKIVAHCEADPSLRIEFDEP
ncbi:DUF4928 family protein [Mesorhizobium sp. B263B2A]|uniref:DUF4928 family protein n=1 Tax=Mesorhizobium sp. B263B2A TaxID=2876669 RepID=UPI001CD12FE0|nr:DUF4928 family protein [Mesorhizobium sp. B263B2A]MCA0029249.1 DUF4928 family protein [Mesorhizobium sp. B263B2A]